MRTYHAATMTELYDQLTDSLIHGTEDDLDIISTVDVQVHDIIAQADSMDWDFDFKSAWLTKSRWSMMVRQYLDPEDLEAWIGRVTSKIGRKNRGIAVLRTKVVKPRGGAATGHTNKETRSWGSCMLNISYKALPVPQITLYSRTSYLGYIGALDLTVAWVVGKYLAKELGLNLRDIRFVWVNQAIQWHNFKSLAYMLNHTDKTKREHYRRLLIESSSELKGVEKREILSHPAIKLSRKWLQKVIKEDASGRTYGDFSYNTFRRIVRRFHTEVYGLEYAQGFEGWSHYKKGPKEGEQKEYFKAYGLLPSVKADSLDLSPIGMPADRKYGEPFVGGDDDDDDEDE
jgi:hypothetical protein